MDAFAYYTLPAGTALASFCTFQLLFHVLSSWFSAKVSPGFNNLSFEKKIEWNSRVVSTCHSLLVGILGLYIVFFDEVVIADPLWGHSSLAQMNIAVTSGYLVSDLLALFLYWRVIGDKYFVIHHCTSLYAFFIIMRYRVLTFVGNFRLLAELSSPFVNQRWFLETLKYPKFSVANVVNGVLMMVVFFLARVAVIPPFYAFMCSVFGTEAYVRLGLTTQCSWLVTCVVLDVMNIMWMVRISRGCLKVLSLFKREKASRRLQNGKLD
ncbi:TLC domain-containing protein 4 isoform X2 [Pteronotus mesoamericanus]|uniref:TLC domain-containing protein 4 isoform X2 n=1 Tax=Pteronotus mesoamericanus TaxID=1884717 RepID=UPI0023EBA8CB|nr:TLC domain-containing protein 4 isoform X2 [Pteronotus parnellii mesoamericanus]